MNSFVRILRQDLRDHAFLIVAWIATLVTSVAAAVSKPFEPPALVDGSQFLALAMVALWLILLSRIIYAHPPANDRAEWRTRPVNAKAVGAAKLVGAILLLVLLPHAIGLSKHVYLGAPPAMMVRFVAQSVFGFLLLTLPILLLASFCRTSGRFLLALGGGLAALIAATTLINARATARRLGEWDPSGVEVALLGGVAISGLAVLFIRQYHRPRTRQNLTLAVALVIGLPAFGFLSRLVPGSRTSLPAGTGIQVDNVEVSLVRPASLLMTGTVKISGWPENTLCSLSLAHLSLEGESSSKPLFPPSITLAEIHPLDTFAEQVGVARVRSRQRDLGHGSLSAASRSLSGAEQSGLQNTVTVRGAVAWVELRAERLAVVPFVEGATHRGNGVILEVGEFSSSEPNRFTLLTTTPASYGRLVLLLVGSDGTAQVLESFTRQSSTVAFEGVTRTSAEYLLDRPAEQRTDSHLALFHLNPVRQGTERFVVERVPVRK